MVAVSLQDDMDLKDLPKIELHLHLDCSLSYDVVQLLSPDIDYEQYRESFVAPGKCTDLADYISRAATSIALMQTDEQLRLVTLDLFKQLKQDHIIYAEIRFAPLEHIQKGLSGQEVVTAVNTAVSEAMEIYMVKAGIILCTLRHYSEAQSIETVKLVDQNLGTHVVGFDIASDEAGFPIHNHVKAFSYAKEKGIPCTAHAGEAKGPESVWETLHHFHPSRIGHGVRSAEDPLLMEYLKKEDIHLEVCPTSNVQTNVIDNIENHPADKIYRSGISMSINTDARTITPVTLTDEYMTLVDLFGWEKAEFLRCNLEAIRHAFTSDETKKQLRREVITAYQDQIP